MGLLAGHTKEPKDTDITSAYYRLLRVENHYPVVDGITTPKSTVTINNLLPYCAYEIQINKKSGSSGTCILNDDKISSSGNVTATGLVTLYKYGTADRNGKLTLSI